VPLPAASGGGCAHLIMEVEVDGNFFGRFFEDFAEQLVGFHLMTMRKYRNFGNREPINLWLKLFRLNPRGGRID
jgi:hypothetical protein